MSVRIPNSQSLSPPVYNRDERLAGTSHVMCTCTRVLNHVGETGKDLFLIG